MPTINKTTYCPECHAKVTLKKLPRLGQIIECRNCHMLLEVIETHPLELDWAPETAFDDEDDYEPDYDHDEDDYAYADYDDE